MTLEEFLAKPTRTVCAKVIALDIHDEELQGENSIITGHVTGGSINIDGASNVRRTCSLSLVCPIGNYTLDDFDWALKTRFKLRIGLEGCSAVEGYTSDSNQPIFIQNSTLWFQLGIYVITQFNASRNATSFNISISGQDKMCLLNGEVDGLLSAEYNFSKYDNYDGSTHYLTIAEMIDYIAQTFAKDGKVNLDDGIRNEKGLKKLEYRGEDPLYLVLQEKAEQDKYDVVYASIYGDQQIGGIKLSEVSNYYVPADAVWPESSQEEQQRQEAQDVGGYKIQKVEFGGQAGYQQTALIYPGDLIAGAGEPVTNVLDKIRDFLGKYEYFYDWKGYLTFQRRRDYIKRGWGEMDNDDSEPDISYIFNNLSLVTALSNSPQIKDIKNDYTIWGEKKSITGDSKIPIHMRVAIDEKPSIYKNYVSNEYEGSLPTDAKRRDWRELIYQMALDSMNGYHKGERTGYEQYYADLLGFWRQLYNPDAETIWREVYYNTPGVKYAQTMQGVNALRSENIEITDYNQWYVAEEGGYIKWIDSLELVENTPIALTNLYTRTGDAWQSIVPTDFPLDIYYLNNERLENAFDSSEASNIYYKDSAGDTYTCYIRTGSEGNNEQCLLDKPAYYKIEDTYTPLISWALNQNKGTIYNIGVKKEKTDDAPIIPLASTISFNRHRLYYKDDSTGVVRYVPLSEYGINNLDDEIQTPYFVKGRKNDFKWEVENPSGPPSFTLLKTTYDGELEEGSSTEVNYKLFSEYSDFDESDYWTKDYERPQNLLFWFDFIDAEDYNKYSCKEIGTRPIVKKESSVGSISYNPSPAVYYDESFQIPEQLESCFRVTTQGQDAFDMLETLLNQHLVAADSISITCLPLYHLEPNTLVKLKAEDPTIYSIGKITIPLEFSGLMTIQASKIPDEITLGKS